MSFCPQCGNSFEGSPNYCSNCGAPLSGAPGSDAPVVATTLEATAVPGAKQEDVEETTVWSGRATNKGFPVAVQYVLTNRRFIYRGGIIGKKEEEILLYRIRDIRIRQSISDRMLGIGNVELISMDATTPTYVIQGIRDFRTLADLVRKYADRERRRRGVRLREEW